MEPKDIDQHYVDQLIAENQQLKQALLEAQSEARTAPRTSASERTAPQAPLDLEGERARVDALLAPLRPEPLGRRLLSSALGHAALVIVASVGFLFGLVRRDAAPVEEEPPREVVAEPAAAPETEVPEASETPEPVLSEPDGDAGRRRMEEALEATSDERPTRSGVNLFDDTIDLDF